MAQAAGLSEESGQQRGCETWRGNQASSCNNIVFDRIRQGMHTATLATPPNMVRQRSPSTQLDAGARRAKSRRLQPGSPAEFGKVATGKRRRVMQDMALRTPNFKWNTDAQPFIPTYDHCTPTGTQETDGAMYVQDSTANDVVEHRRHQKCWSDLPAADMPFKGDLRGCTWNTQALFARRAVRHHCKLRHVKRLANEHDFVALQETHSTKGGTDALRLPTGFTPFWSHGTTTRAGIGLIVKDDFLRNFNHPRDGDWIEVVPSWAAILRLSGSQGSLDICVVYMATGDSEARTARNNTRMQLQNSLKPENITLTILLGDFNYVVSERDWVTKDTAEWSGDQDGLEEEAFTDGISQRFGLYELEQEHMTCETAVARSRIDRVYWNQHLSEQLDRHFGSAGLAWVPGLSAHRPVSFFRRRPSKLGPLDAPLPLAPLRDPDWPRRVALQYGELRRTDDRDDQPLRRLALLKRAVKDVTLRMRAESHVLPADSGDDRLGWTIRFIRSAEEVRLVTMDKCVKAYPHLRSMADPNDPNVREGYSLTKVRNHAVELAREISLNEMRALQAERDGIDELQPRARRESIQVRLKRISPGKSTCLRAMEDDERNISTDPTQIAANLRKHWGQVFSRQDINEDILQEWLRETFPDGGQGEAVCGLPTRDSTAWQLQRSDMEKSIQASTNTMPGPDRIPYAAWRALGDLAVDILFEAARALALPDGTRLLVDALGEGDEGSHDFNMAILCCLPKKPIGCTPEHGEYFSADATRPLAIVNTDNRLIAGAYRGRLEPIMEPWISLMQRGFLKGRSMIANIVDIDFEAMRISLNCAEGALVLFDFRAAFPSVSHAYLRASLTHIGLPATVLSLVDALYDQNKCIISLQGCMYDGFEIRAGIRQGCPLSPLIFAVIADLLLRRLAAIIPDDVVRAFADDTAAAIKD